MNDLTPLDRYFAAVRAYDTVRHAERGRVRPHGLNADEARKQPADLRAVAIHQSKRTRKLGRRMLRAWQALSECDKAQVRAMAGRRCA